MLSKGPPAPGDRRNRVMKTRRKRSFPQRGVVRDCDEQLREGRTSDDCFDSQDAQKELLHPVELKQPASRSLRSPNNASSNWQETSTPWVGQGTIDPRLILPCSLSTEDCWVDSTPNLTVSAVGGSRLPSVDRVLNATQAENDWDRQMLLFPPGQLNSHSRRYRLVCLPCSRRVPDGQQCPDRARGPLPCA